MNNTKQQIQQEAQQIALRLYNLNLEKTTLELRMKELGASNQAVEALEKELAPEDPKDPE